MCSFFFFFFFFFFLFVLLFLENFQERKNTLGFQFEISELNKVEREREIPYN